MRHGRRIWGAGGELVRRGVFLLCAVGVGAEEVPLRTEAGFLVPQPGARMEFPRDHGNHPDYRIEWWYLTGHLEMDEGEEAASPDFGFQATFFRTARAVDHPEADTGFEPVRQLHLAHMALTDVTTGTFHHEERLNREGWNAQSATERLDLHNGNWSLEMVDPETGAMQLQFTAGGDVHVFLDLIPEKPLVRFGEDGTSRKGADPAARSFYLSFTRLRATGIVETPEGRFDVSGLAWMDHEIASQQLGSDLAGWDWTAIQFEDGSELKAYILRKEDGEPDPWSAAIWINPEGVTTHVDATGFSWERERWWTSRSTGNRYPVEVRIEVPDPETGTLRLLELRPVLDAQELDQARSAGAYWEGACVVLEKGEPVGRAYLELVGYGSSDNLRGL